MPADLVVKRNARYKSCPEIFERMADAVGALLDAGDHARSLTRAEGWALARRVKRTLADKATPPAPAPPAPEAEEPPVSHDVSQEDMRRLLDRGRHHLHGLVDFIFDYMEQDDTCASTDCNNRKSGGKDNCKECLDLQAAFAKDGRTLILD